MEAAAAESAIRDRAELKFARKLAAVRAHDLDHTAAVAYQHDRDSDHVGERLWHERLFFELGCLADDVAVKADIEHIYAEAVVKRIAVYIHRIAEQLLCHVRKEFLLREIAYKIVAGADRYHTNLNPGQWTVLTLVMYDAVYDFIEGAVSTAGIESIYIAERLFCQSFFYVYSGVAFAGRAVNFIIDPRDVTRVLDYIGDSFSLDALSSDRVYNKNVFYQNCFLSDIFMR